MTMGIAVGKGLRLTALGLAAAALIAGAVACDEQQASTTAVESDATGGTAAPAAPQGQREAATPTVESGAADETSTPTASQGQQEAATPAPASAAPAHPLEEAARAAAAAHEGLTDAQAAQMELTLWEAVSWPSSALGCEKEGYMYAAVVVPGYRATFDHEGRTIMVHVGEDAESAFVPQGCVNDPGTTGFPREE